eukprot:COSAG05_NODE_289_length_12065_cov_9.271519_2_plen_61_part_00
MVFGTKVNPVVAAAGSAARTEANPFAGSGGGATLVYPLPTPRYHASESSEATDLTEMTEN